MQLDRIVGQVCDRQTWRASRGDSPGDILGGVSQEHSTTTGSEEDRRLLAQWASDCAERVLPLFEARHSGDDRPRKAVEAARAWVRGEIRVGQARKVASAAHAVARDATDPAARAAARSTGQAVGTAHMGGHARHAANYAATAVTHASSGDSEAGARERAWQYQRIPVPVRAFTYPNGDPK